MYIKTQGDHRRYVANLQNLIKDIQELFTKVNEGKMRF